MGASSSSQPVTVKEDLWDQETKRITKKERTGEELCSAAGAGDLKTTAKLLDSQDPNYRNQSGSTALIEACSGGHHEVVEILIARKANIHLQDQDGSSALHKASKNGHRPAVEMLLSAKADLNTQDMDGQNALHLASAWNHFKVVDVLLKYKADVNHPFRDGKTPLHWACLHGNIGLAEVMIKSNGEINRQDKGGWTPLQCASFWNHSETVGFLLQYGADLKTTNQYKETARDLALSRDNDSVISLFDRRGPGSQKQSSLSLAPTSKHDRIAAAYERSIQYLQAELRDLTQPIEGKDRQVFQRCLADIVVLHQKWLRLEPKPQTVLPEILSKPDRVVYKWSKMKLGEEIGADVFKAEYEDKMVVVKKLRHRQDIHELLAGFVPHPNVAQVGVVYPEQPREHYGLVTEYYKNGSLSSLPFPPDAEASVKILREVCQGLAHLHRQGIFHKGLTRSNVLISSTGEVKLSDFGLFVREEQASEYFSPEVKELAREEIPTGSAQNDMGAFAALLWELVLHRSIVPRSSHEDVSKKGLDDGTLPIRDVVKRIGAIEPRIVVTLIGCKQNEDLRLTAEEALTVLSALWIPGSDHMFQGECALDKLRRLMEVDLMRFPKDITRKELAHALTIGLPDKSSVVDTTLLDELIKEALSTNRYGGSCLEDILRLMHNRLSVSRTIAPGEETQVEYTVRGKQLRVRVPTDCATSNAEVIVRPAAPTDGRARSLVAEPISVSFSDHSQPRRPVEIIAETNVDLRYVNVQLYADGEPVDTVYVSLDKPTVAIAFTPHFSTIEFREVAPGLGLALNDAGIIEDTSRKPGEYRHASATFDGDSKKYSRGGMPYLLPCHFERKAVPVDVPRWIDAKDTIVAYHGVPNIGTAIQILKDHFKLPSVLGGVQKGHIGLTTTKFGVPNWGDAIFLSPSHKYSMAYAKKGTLRKNIDGGWVMASGSVDRADDTILFCLLQCRVKKDGLTKHPITQELVFGDTSRLPNCDFRAPATALEYRVANPAMIAPVGIMLRRMPATQVDAFIRNPNQM